MIAHKDIELSQHVLMAQVGDRDALEKIFIFYQRPLFRYLKHVVGNQQDAEDLLQKVFLQVYQKIAMLKEPALIRPWIYRIATHLCHKHFKQSKRGDTTSIDEGLIDSEDPFGEAVGFRIDVERHLGKLNPRMREVLVLYFLDELQLAEIADILNIPLGTVKSRIFTALKFLKASVDD